MFKRNLLVPLQFLLLISICTWSPTPATVSAHDGFTKGPSSAVLRMAVIRIGPLPISEVLDPALLERIATEARLQHWQLPDEKPWPVEDGQPVVAHTRRLDEFWHVIQRGQNATRLREMYRVNRQTLQEMNPDLDIGNLREGDEVLVWKREPDTFARSFGYANGGRLLHGEPLPGSENYIQPYPHRNFGTYYTISEIVRSLDAYYDRFPEADPLIIGDISFRIGRGISPHRSHQSGRDVDITLPRHRPPPNYNRFHHIHRRNLDAEKALWLLKEFIDGGHVEYMFLDRFHQRTLRREAERQGATQEWMDAVFQYPHHSGGQAIIRHARGHSKHFHVRFKCQPTDRRCR